MSDRNWTEVRPLTPEQRNTVMRDLELIAQGEELDMPWRRVRILLDHKLAEVCHPVITQGSNTSLNLTDAGLRFMDQANDQSK
ncbi:hypothetical protein [Shinella sumterensis]|jgi:hypothetical protein|uniref:Uncharacterized protein n=1 Tax=Shinella sumterensis TaxID=1967501 RepID=A0AA50CRD1_9HYPH|nr:hypothetical protein [Shinella sumterensis]WLS01356.1 hypothetical protein Q9313_28580 [Shinella sumterensis]